ncbi:MULTISPECIES: carbonate dehydratase [Chromohalobacter]|uniref:carbonate dehydratase n=1 Tax=Chromohalobacter TaxID=42054 RepID=UPI0005584BB2|nr:carbonate dehydratase [Chromohalobacter israelensis]MDF9435500.1 carbonate dehydratase [Chromohalobacter israelensis]
MSDIKKLLTQNRQWAAGVQERDPDFFERLSHQQNPDYLWIGCSDSRVPANQIIDLPPGEVFVHRNVANLLYHNDMNALSVVQYAVDVLQVEHIMVVGHYGCGGVRAAVTGGDNGMIDYWLHSVRELYSVNREALKDLSLDDKVDRMCELNVRAQVANLCRAKVVQRAWQRGQSLSVHGWVYGLSDGCVTDLECTVSQLDDASHIHRFDPVPPQTGQ